MALDTSEGNSSSDAAAIEAAASFWADSDKAEAAEKESPSESASLRVLANDEQDSRDAEEQAASDAVPEKVAEKQTPTKQTQAAKPAEPATPAGLDPILRSIALDSGWTNEEVDEAYGLNAEAATRQFTRLADQYAEMSRQFLPPTPGTTPAVAQVQPAQAQQISPVASPLSDEALKKFAETNGQEAADALKLMRDHFNAQTSELSTKVQAFEQQIQAQQAQVIAQEANTVLSDLRGKFPTLYGNGNDPTKLTMAQHQKFTDLVNLADDMRKSAAGRGVSLGVKDALTRAHYVVSRESVKTEARSEIQAQIKQRSARATARPSQRSNPAAPGVSGRSDEAALAAFAEKAAEIGLND